MAQENKLIEYVYEFATYAQQGQKFTADCNFIAFQNEGSDILTLNGNLTIQPYQLVWLPGNSLEIDRTQYTVHFDKLSYANGLQKLVVIRKIYKNPELLARYKDALAK